MFNSGLFADITDYSDYTHNPLILAVNVQYKELLEFVDCCWQNEKAKGALFQNHFQKYFPPGYIDRDPGKAREIYKSLLHIPQSDMIRTDLPPICTYVMYQFIVEYGPFTRLSKACWYTEELEQYMKAMPQRSEILVNQKDVKQWFKDIRTWCIDFEITYDSDYVCLESIEAFGTLYLQNDEQSRKRFSQLGIDIEELADLLPFDLRSQVLKKVEAQKRFIPVDEKIVHKAIISASEKLAASPADCRNLDEDALNRKMRNIIESKLEDRGYSIHDQTQRGLGKSGQKPGELDILIKKEGLPVTIIEGMIHRDRRYLTEHIEKAVGRYNISGCRLVYVLVYTREIDKDWMDTRSWINDFPGLSGNDVDSGFEKIKIFEGLYAESIETRIIAIPIGK